MVEASDGGFVIGGFTESYGVNQSDVWLVRMADLPLWWVTKPQDILIDFGIALSYDLDVGSSLGIDSWWVNDTTNFAVDGEGVITNTPLLNVGDYGVQINVNDIQNNILSETFTVTVLPGSLPPAQPLNVIQIFILIAVLDVVGLVLIVLFLRFRKYQFK